MHKADYLDFGNLLDQLARLYGRDALEDEDCQLYWAALRDIPLEAVKACALIHQKRSKFFPKPAELRPKGDTPREVIHDDGKLAAAERVNVRNWEEQLRENEPLAKWQLLSAYLARTDNVDPGSIVYEERMRFCRTVARRLLEQFGHQWCVANPHCMHAASRLLGGKYISASYAQAVEEAA